MTDHTRKPKPWEEGSEESCAALIAVNRLGGQASTEEILRRTGIRPALLSQVLLALSKRGWLEYSTTSPRDPGKWTLTKKAKAGDRQ